MSSFSGSGGGGAADGNTVGAAEAPVFAVSGYFGSNVTLSGTQSATQGSAANGEIVLVSNNTNATQNGLYTVNTGGAWSRLSYYTAALVIRSQIRVISPPYGGKFAVFDYVGATDPVVFGSSSIPYAIRMNETNSTDFNIRGLVSAGAANVNFFTNGGSVGSVATATISRGSGANGNLDITNNGLGGFSISGGAGLTLNGGASSNVNIATNMTGGDCNIGQVGSANDAFPRIYLNGPTRATAGISTPANRITTGSASSPTARQLQIFFDPAGAAIASYTVTLPASSALVDGQELLVHSGAFGVTALTLTAGSGTTIRAAIATLAADSFARYKYIAATTMWVRIG